MILARLQDHPAWVDTLVGVYSVFGYFCNEPKLYSMCVVCTLMLSREIDVGD